MKKIFCTLLSVLVITFSFAQTVPNGGFEEWTDNTHPVSWNASFQANFPVTYSGIDLDLGIDFNAALKYTSAPHSGNAAMEVVPQTANAYFFSTTPIYSIPLPGIVQLGQFNVAAIQNLDIENVDISDASALDLTQYLYGGIACSQLPAKVTAWLMYAPVNNDTLRAGVIATRWNNGQREIVAQADLLNGSAWNEYTQIELPLEVRPGMEGVTPDTLNIIFSTGGATANAETRLYIDDVAIVMEDDNNDTTNTDPTHIMELTTLPIFSVYPNPATDHLVIRPLAGSTYAARLYDLNGKIVWEGAGLQANTNVNVSELPVGTYFLQVKQADAVRTEKVVLR